MAVFVRESCIKGKIVKASRKADKIGHGAVEAHSNVRVGISRYVSGDSSETRVSLDENDVDLFHFSSPFRRLNSAQAIRIIS